MGRLDKSLDGVSKGIEMTEHTIDVAPAQLPSFVFAISFPKPLGHSADIPAPFFLYTFPRAICEKPPIDPETGKRAKEKYSKKVKRKWQGWIEGGERIDIGECGRVGIWKRLNGALARFGGRAMRFQSNDLTELVGRLPPHQKLGEVTIFYRETPTVSGPFDPISLRPEEIKEGLMERLAETSKKTKYRKIISAAFLPITLAADILLIVPLLLFEINLAYFAIQSSRAKRMRALSRAEARAVSQQKKYIEGSCEQTKEPVVNSVFNFVPINSQSFDRINGDLYKVCLELDTEKISKLVKNDAASDEALNQGCGVEMISIFKARAPDNVVARHQLDEKRVSKDIERIMRREAKRYIKTLK